jgi:hypothetical protein
MMEMMLLWTSSSCALSFWKPVLVFLSVRMSPCAIFCWFACVCVSPCPCARTRVRDVYTIPCTCMHAYAWVYSDEFIHTFMHTSVYMKTFMYLDTSIHTSIPSLYYSRAQRTYSLVTNRNSLTHAHTHIHARALSLSRARARSLSLSLARQAICGRPRHPAAILSPPVLLMLLLGGVEGICLGPGWVRRVRVEEDLCRRLILGNGWPPWLCVCRLHLPLLTPEGVYLPRFVFVGYYIYIYMYVCTYMLRPN